MTIILARAAVERAADAMLGLAAPVPGRGVEIADPAVPGGAEHRRRLVVLDPVEKVAERGGAEAELADPDVRPAELARLERRSGARAHSSGSVPKRRG